ncbi:hypothetical protein Patl1_36464 [Pistacia atlantica]|nr:hypothetical protein Patl1_36464 [Pistacia atlantica]
MDSFEIKNIKLGKANGVAKKPQFRKIASLFRVIEICVLLVVVARIFAYLPLAVKDLTDVLVSTRFVFIIGNLIVVILFAKSGQFSAQDSTRKNPRKDYFEEFLEKGEKIQNTHRYEVKYREKQSICAENVVSEGTHTSFKSNSYRRSQSEKFKRVNSDKSCRELRRSATATEKCRKSTNSGDKSAKNSYPEDNMSNEEFRRTIEAFIARQQRFRMEEEYSVIT